MNDFHHSPARPKGVGASHHAFGGRVMVLGAVFVASDLAIEFVDQLVDGGVQILMGALGKQVAAFDVDAALGTLALFFFLLDRKSTRLNSSHSQQSRMPSSA